MISLGKSMLITSDNLLFLHLLDDDLQDELVHHLSRDGGEADRPMHSSLLIIYKGATITSAQPLVGLPLNSI